MTDALIEAWGPTFEEALAQAALGLEDTMVEAKEVKPTIEETVEIEGHDELELVYNWLERILLSFEVDHQVFEQFEINSVKKLDGKVRLTARLQGGTFDLGIHRAKVEVKGITYHLMQVRRDPQLVTIRYLVDL